MKVLKFGGTSVRSPEAIRTLVRIVQESSEHIVVVSAFSGVTDMLLRAARMASRGEDWRAVYAALRERHIGMMDAVLGEGRFRDEAGQTVLELLSELESLLYGISLVRDLSARTQDLVASFGERMSAIVVAKAMEKAGMPAEWVDARDIIKTDGHYGSARWLEVDTVPLVRSRLGALDHRAVVTGFIGSTADGSTTTLGRGGSDLTAGILGACLDAEEIEIWTDVDGIMTADPRMVPDAFVISEISYLEAMEMSHFGAKVLHPPTVLPAMAKGIPLRIRNTFNPTAPGTLIVRQAKPSNWPIRGIASIADIALILLQGPGLPGVTGIAGRMFGALARVGVNVILITQGSSELSICCAVMPDDAQKGAEALQAEFALEINAGVIASPAVARDLCAIAVVGEMMKHRVGISGNVFRALGRNGVNVVAIAQGSSELNISIVVASQDRAKAMRAIHDAFFLGGVKTVHVFLVGLGLIGGTLMRQIAEQHLRLSTDHAIRLKVAGIANSRKMLIDAGGIDPAHWADALETRGTRTDLAVFIEQMRKLNLPNACFVDCTASDAPVAWYETVIQASISIVTPNKRANSAHYRQYQRLRELARRLDVPYRYETTVGAGLPVIGTIQDLVASGDRILAIEAVLSGTLSYIFNTLGKGKTFSSLVREAKELGYTEPDPRDDLAAIDIARKALILAREAGFVFEEADLSIEPLVPADITGAASTGEFLDRLAAIDRYYEDKAAQAAARGEVLRYVASIRQDKVEIALRSFGPESPLYSLSGTDNIVVITTSRYSKYPLVIRGPGAGAEVTAGGVFADILKTAESYL